MIWEHGKQFIETLNAFHLTIKFTAEWSREEINILDVNVRLRNRQLETDLHIKPTDTLQNLDSTSCYLYHCKKSIPYSQALRYNRIYSDNEKYNQLCNDLRVASIPNLSRKTSKWRFQFNPPTHAWKRHVWPSTFFVVKLLHRNRQRKQNSCKNPTYNAMITSFMDVYETDWQLISLFKNILDSAIIIIFREKSRNNLI